MKKFAIICAAVGIFASAVFYFSGVIVSQKTGAFHYYLVPEVKISGIKLEVIYFVPADQQSDPRFHETLKQTLVQMQNFHSREFKGLNALRFALYPRAVIGRESSSFYDGADTSRGNFGAMGRIFTETAARVYRRESDEYDAQFTKRKEGELPIRLFVYQGVGASSGTLSVIASYDYITQTEHGATTLYHEILHNLGVPDAYDYETNAPQSDDIMGSGRTKSIMETYVRDEIKRKIVQ